MPQQKHVTLTCPSRKMLAESDMTQDSAKPLLTSQMAFNAGFAGLPPDVRSKIISLTIPIMSIDQRRAAGVRPGKLMLADDLRCRLMAAINVSWPLHVRAEVQVEGGTVKHDTAVAGSVLRLVPSQAKYAKTCRVLAVGCSWSEFDTEEVYEVVLTGVPSWFKVPPRDQPSCTIFEVV